MDRASASTEKISAAGEHSGERKGYGGRRDTSFDSSALRAKLKSILTDKRPDLVEHDLYEIAEGLDAPGLAAMMDALRDLGREDLRAQLLGYWLEVDFKGARAFMGKLPIEEVDRLLEAETLQTWVRQDVHDLAKWYASLPAGDRSKSGKNWRYSITLAMVNVDPAAALQTSMQRFASEPPDGSQPDLFRQWAKTDPEAAAARALELPPSKIRNQAIPEILEEWEGKDPDAPRAWVNGLQDPQLKERATVGLAEAISKTDPSGAAQLLVQPGRSPQRQRLLDHVLEIWVKKDSDAALAWADTQTAESVRTNAKLEAARVARAAAQGKQP